MPSSPQGRGIGLYLVASILLAVVPLFVIAGVLVARQQALQREALEQSLLEGSRALSLAVDRQLASYQVMLETLTESEVLRRDDFPRLYEVARRVADRNGAVFISYFDATGRQIFNTIRPPGENLPTPFKDARGSADDARPPTGDDQSLKHVLETGRPAVSDLFLGLVAGRFIFTVNVPVFRDGKVAY